MSGGRVDETVEEPDREFDRASERYAYVDPVLAEGLEQPTGPGAIYLEEASVLRPIATGDIFLGTSVPGPKDDARPPLAMIVSHPSAMRRGAELEPWARAAPVLPVHGFSKKKWTRGHFGVFPLPLLRGVATDNGFDIPDQGWAALLDFSAPVETAELDVRQRIACLSPDGMHLLLQQLVHETWVAVATKTLSRVFAPKLEELEMLQTWNEELVAKKVDAGGDLYEELAAAAGAFESVMSETNENRPISLRAMIEGGSSAGEAHRLFVAELSSRRP